MDIFPTFTQIHPKYRVLNELFYKSIVTDIEWSRVSPWLVQKHFNNEVSELLILILQASNLEEPLIKKSEKFHVCPKWLVGTFQSLNKGRKNPCLSFSEKKIRL